MHALRAVVQCHGGRETKQLIYGSCGLGDMNTVLGTYRLIRVLRAIGRWVDEDLATWRSDLSSL